MPADQLVFLVAGLALIAGLAATVAYATSHAARRSGTARAGAGRAGAFDDEREDARGPGADRHGGPSGPPVASGVMGTLFVSPASTRQVARIVAFLFLAAAAVVVALSGAWPETEAGIFTLLALGTLLVVLFMDMLPPSVLGRWRRPAEGLGAIVFLGLLMALTGGVASPFFVGFFLVVAGTALSTEGWAPLAIAIVAAATMALVGLVASGGEAIGVSGLAWIGFNSVAVILLADIATAAARAQRQARDDAIQASRFDALTGLFNRSFFFTTMEQEIRRSDRMGRGFVMLMLDLDDLKPVNDTFGHQWGDRLLKSIADVVRHTIRFTDSAARYGGDEFVVLLPETDPAGGFVVGEKLRRDVAALVLHAGDRNVRSSVSVGLVSYPDDGTSIEQLVAAADIAMYEAKRRGKNRIVGYQTRMERVATAIDISSAEPISLVPATDVRTGGDPAPWGDVGGGSRATGQAVGSGSGSGSGTAPGPPPTRRQPAASWDQPARRLDEPWVPGSSDWPRPPRDAGWTSEPGTVADAGGPESGPVARSAAPGAGTPRTSEAGPAGKASVRSSPGDPDVAAPDALSARGRIGAEGRRRSDGRPVFGDAARPVSDGADASTPDAAVAPWLTRTNGMGSSPSPGPLGAAVPGTSTAGLRPTASGGPASGGSATDGTAASERTDATRAGTRSEEIRKSGERPWIALPIEPYEPPERDRD